MYRDKPQVSVWISGIKSEKEGVELNFNQAVFFESNFVQEF